MSGRRGAGGGPGADAGRGGGGVVDGGSVLVTGATYFLGAHVARAASRRADEVRCTPASSGAETGRGAGPGSGARRDIVDRAAGPAALSWRDAGVHDGGALTRLMDGCDVVFHCDEDYRVWAREPRAIYRHNVDGTRTVLEAAAEAGAGRVVYTSSVGCLGRTDDDTPADETTPAELEDMIGHYQRSKYLAERVVEEAAEAGLPVVTVNPPASVGEMDFRPTPVGGLIVDFVNGDVPAYMESGRNFVDARAVARGHLAAAARGEPGRRYVLGGANLRLGDFLEALAEVTGLAPPRLRLPQWVALAYAAVQEALARVRGGPPEPSLEGVRAARQKMFFDASRAEEELGWRPPPLAPALERAVAWFGRQGRLDPERVPAGAGAGGGSRSRDGSPAATDEGGAG